MAIIDVTIELLAQLLDGGQFDAAFIGQGMEEKPEGFELVKSIPNNRRGVMSFLCRGGNLPECPVGWEYPVVGLYCLASEATTKVKPTHMPSGGTPCSGMG